MNQLAVKVRYAGVHKSYTIPGVMGEGKRFIPRVGQKFYITNGSLQNLINQGYEDDFKIVDESHRTTLGTIVTIIAIIQGLLGA